MLIIISKDLSFHPSFNTNLIIDGKSTFELNRTVFVVLSTEY